MRNECICKWWGSSGTVFLIWYYKLTHTNMHIYAYICKSVIKKNLIISDHNHTGNAHVKSSFPHTFADKLWLNLQNLFSRNLLSCLEYLRGFFNQKQTDSSQHKEIKGRSERVDCILKLASSAFSSMEPQWRACTAPESAEENTRIWLRSLRDTFSQLTQIMKRKYTAQWEREIAMYY